MKLNPIAPLVRPILLACLAVALLNTDAEAQLQVSMALSKRDYITHEPITAKIRVNNLAGHDLILAGPGGGGWLNVDITMNSKTIHGRRDAPQLKPISLKQGGVYETTINLGSYFPLAQPGNYGITASVYYPPLKKYFPSKRKLANVLKAKTLWSQSFGIAQGQNRPVQFRKYSLLGFRGRNNSELYVRLASQDGLRVFQTYSLGKVLRSYEPGVDLDAANRLHILHLGGPDFYAHSIIETDGSLISQTYYKKIGATKPELRNQSGSIVVKGGVKTDRHGLVGTPQAPRTFDPADTNRERSASERPPGLPR